MCHDAAWRREIIMRKLIIAAVIVAALAACGRQSSDEASVDAGALVSGLALEYMDTSVRPGDDFFRYMNGKWLDETEIPADKASYGGFVILADEAQENLRAIIDEASTGDFEKGSDEQKVGDLYNSYLDMETRNARGVEPLAAHFAQIDKIATQEDLARYMAGGSRRSISMPIDIDQLVDWNDSSKYSMFVTQGGLGLPDREYYLKDDDQSQSIREAYVTHIGKMFDLAGLPDGTNAAQTIMALETRLAERNMPKEEVRNRAKNYQIFARAQWTDVMPEFPWQAWLDEVGVPDVDSLVLYMTDYLSALDGILGDTDLDTWKTYLYWNELNNAASRLSADLDAQNFEFFGKVLSGTEEQRPMWRRATMTVSGSLGEVVGKVYVAKHFPPEAKRRMEALVGNLIKAYEVSIRDLDWMSDATKQEALRKLSKFEAKVGYPDEWKDYSALEIDADDLYGNLERAALVEHQREINRHYGPVDRGEWGMTPQTVNAYYSPALNQIVFPAAILQPPFFNLEADDAVNYGAIGAVIGHEIGHGFDDQGSTFDGNGALRNWWTDEDRAEFEERTRALIAQYDEFRPFDDLAVNGEFTQGENIGDLGGISIGLLAYKLSIDGAEPPVIDGFTGVQRVFLGYAQVWRNKYRDELLRRLIATDSHSPTEYRANGAVRNVPEWYEAFGVQPGDALYIPPEERVKIW
jgi:putative endopeptidase